MSKKTNYLLPRQQLEDLLKSVGVVLAGGTATDIIGYCPFHNNRDSPAFNISMGSGHQWKCWSGKCGKTGNLITLLKLKGYSFSEASKMVKMGQIEVSDLVAHVQEILREEVELGNSDWKDVDPSVFSTADASSGYPAREYLASRGVGEEAYTYFQMGYSASKDMLAIPVFEPGGNLAGVIGRQIQNKRYQYSTGLTRGKLIWNLNNAKHHDSIILTEGALDAVYVWQAGYLNVGAVLGSALSAKQMHEIKKYFTEIVCFLDNDDAGDGLRDQLLENVRDIEVSFVTYPERMIPVQSSDGEWTERPIKDPGELTLDEIQTMVENRKTSLHMLLSKI